MSVLKIDDVDVFRNNIRGKLNGILQNEKNSANLEKGIFNYALKEADQNKVVKKWDNKRFVQIYVQDNGHGIKKEDKPKLFKPFGKLRQQNTSINREGIGFGLNTCK